VQGVQQIEHESVAQDCKVQQVPALYTGLFSSTDLAMVKLVKLGQICLSLNPTSVNSDFQPTLPLRCTAARVQS
jgi:hypothetical protein